jgi:hydrogenase maturation protease
MKKTAVIGIGNPLRRDDGIGIILLEKLVEKKDNLSENLEYIDGGTGGMNLLHLLASYDKVLIIDAVDFKGKPGDYKIFKSNKVISQKQSIDFSTHESDMLKIIKLSKKLDECPDEILIFGIQPKDVSYGQNLSDEIKQVIDLIIKNLEKEINIFIRS